MDTSNPNAVRVLWLDGELLPRTHTANGGETRTLLALGAHHLVEVGENRTAVTVTDPAAPPDNAAASVPAAPTASAADCVEVLLLDSDDGADEQHPQKRRDKDRAGSDRPKRPRLVAPGPATAPAAPPPEHTIGEEIADGGSEGSRKRLMRDLRRIKTSAELQMFRVEVEYFVLFGFNSPPPAPPSSPSAPSARPFVPWPCADLSARTMRGAMRAVFNAASRADAGSRTRWVDVTAG